MNEQKRLQALKSYQILDTPPEQALDDLAEIASAICDTPISLVSFIDEHRQWFKAKKGLQVDETPRRNAFCQHALHHPQEVLVVDDPLNDERFKDNPLVLGNPHIRFYAGAPLATSQGNVLGTLCIIDHKPNHISENQKKALQLLAQKAMDYLQTRQQLLSQNQQIEQSAVRLKKLTDLAPGAFFQLEMDPTGAISFPFISKGIKTLYPALKAKDLRAHPELGLMMIHAQDRDRVTDSFQAALDRLKPWTVEFRVPLSKERIAWYWAHAHPQRQDNGTVAWYGSIQDVSHMKAHQQTLEQILFDISHVMRRPVSTMLGLTAAIEREDTLDEDQLRAFSQHLKTVSEEMDLYITRLNEDYTQLQMQFKNF